ncbi:hypothetical protein ACCO45_009394 [Purpureocillium lilacinum]|uniref:Uncharacterized protein n=1 Tax=Purpureocillium lilacinum TaxID=33203 RepID=A0ACC4DKE2_PURLI
MSSTKDAGSGAWNIDDDAPPMTIPSSANAVITLCIAGMIHPSPGEESIQTTTSTAIETLITLPACMRDTDADADAAPRAWAPSALPAPQALHPGLQGSSWRAQA